MATSSFYDVISKGESMEWLGYKYTDRSMFGLFGNEQDYWVGF